MEFFTLIMQVSSRTDHPDAFTGQTCKDLLISAYRRKCLEKENAATSATLQIELINTSFEMSIYHLAALKKFWWLVDYYMCGIGLKKVIFLGVKNNLKSDQKLWEYECDVKWEHRYVVHYVLLCGKMPIQCYTKMKKPMKIARCVSARRSSGIACFMRVVLPPSWEEACS